MYFTIDITCLTKKRFIYLYIYVCICTYIEYLYIHKEIVGFFALEESNKNGGNEKDLLSTVHPFYRFNFYYVYILPI